MRHCQALYMRRSLAAQRPSLVLVLQRVRIFQYRHWQQQHLTAPNSAASLARAQCKRMKSTKPKSNCGKTSNAACTVRYGDEGDRRQQNRGFWIVRSRLGLNNFNIFIRNGQLLDENRFRLSVPHPVTLHAPQSHLISV